MGGLSFGILKSGGPIMVVLAALSLASLALIAVKVIELWSCRSGEGARRTAIAKWAAGDTSGARAAVAGGRSGGASGERRVWPVAGEQTRRWKGRSG